VMGGGSVGLEGMADGVSTVIGYTSLISYGIGLFSMWIKY
jgi:hypothetical protein